MEQPGAKKNYSILFLLVLVQLVYREKSTIKAVLYHMLPTATQTRSKLTFVSQDKYKIIWKISRGTWLWTLNKDR